MSKKVILTCDSTCDLGEDIKKEYGIELFCPLHINYADKSYDDGVDIFPDDIFKTFYKTGTLPSTAAVSIGEYVDFFKPFIDDGCEVVHINLAAELSCSYANACAAAKMLGGVYPIDSHNLSTGSGLLVLEAADRIRAGMEAKQIAEEISAIVDESHASFILDTLKFLAAGGRCSQIVAFGANLLQLKPSIQVDAAKGGKMGVAKKYRGKFEQCVASYVNDQLDRYPNIKKTRVFITHSGIYDGIVPMVQKIIEDRNIFDKIYITRAGCTISSHCGPNCIGVLFMTE